MCLTSNKKHKDDVTCHVTVYKITSVEM